jgi:putative SOS response-associated peptidase YedK
MRWGLIPYWAKDIKIGFSTINARAEEVDTKPAFREAFRQRRCLLPLDSFYEWKKTATGKQPYAIALKDRRLMGMAGLWETWRSPVGESGAPQPDARGVEAAGLAGVFWRRGG